MADSDPFLTYSNAGVDIEAGESAVEAITSSVEKTHGPGVLGGLGGFGGLFALKDACPKLADPVLVSGADGVGTKLLVAIAANNHGTVGQDLVAMCVNDILTLGARPLFFLDYFGTSKLAPDQMATVVNGIAQACEQTGCALLGGETAELPGLYKKGDYDLAGFAVGAVDRSQIIDGTKISAGHQIIGLTSSGLHSNGYSLARQIVFERMGLKVDDILFDNKTVAEVLLTPTKLYGPMVLPLLDAGFSIDGMSHITGGGITGNLARCLPDGMGAKVYAGAWPEPKIFDLLREKGPVVEDEMRRAFNIGLGFALFVPEKDAEQVLAALSAAQVDAYTVGEVVVGEGVSYVEQPA
jgi:phosphoribosylformylglycinamidine cyclo-ligase